MAVVVALLLGTAVVARYGMLRPQQAPPTPLMLHIFFTPTCPDCAKVKERVHKLAHAYGRLRVLQHDLSEPENVELMAEYYRMYDVPEDQWEGTIAVFVGDRWWNDTDRILAELGRTISRLAATGNGARQSPRVPASEGSEDRGQVDPRRGSRSDWARRLCPVPTHLPAHPPRLLCLQAHPPVICRIFQVSPPVCLVFPAVSQPFRGISLVPRAAAARSVGLRPRELLRGVPPVAGGCMEEAGSRA